jgi:hypothetical protein
MSSAIGTATVLDKTLLKRLEKVKMKDLYYRGSTESHGDFPTFFRVGYNSHHRVYWEISNLDLDDKDDEILRQDICRFMDRNYKVEVRSLYM